MNNKLIIYRDRTVRYLVQMLYYRYLGHGKNLWSQRVRANVRTGCLNVCCAVKHYKRVNCVSLI